MTGLGLIVGQCWTSVLGKSFWVVVPGLAAHGTGRQAPAFAGNPGVRQPPSRENKLLMPECSPANRSTGAREMRAGLDFMAPLVARGTYEDISWVLGRVVSP